MRCEEGTKFTSFFSKLQFISILLSDIYLLSAIDVVVVVVVLVVVLICSPVLAAPFGGLCGRGGRRGIASVGFVGVEFFAQVKVEIVLVGGSIKHNV